jgi:hypothetical protein
MQRIRKPLLNRKCSRFIVSVQFSRSTSNKDREQTIPLVAGLGYPTLSNKAPQELPFA